MSASQRNKGAAGERELFALLTEQLGVTVTRNLTQTRGGGADALDVPGWAIECKRCEALSLASWWNQARRQADDLDRKPALFYRQSRKPWRAVLDLHHIAPGVFTAPGSLCELALSDACTVIRESLGGES
ncbi:MAG: putative PDDEXK endonuclease [Acidithiobacillus ferrivorans]